MREEVRRLYNAIPEKPMTPITAKQWMEYTKSSESHIFLKPITEKDIKVRDHCHHTGEFRGPAHRMCNLRYKVCSFIPMVFHNLSGYDVHLVIKDLSKYTTNNMNVIAKSKENYISFSAHVPVQEYIDKDGNEKTKSIKLRFIDSFKFMALTLDSLTNNLVKGDKRLFDLSNDPIEYKLLTRKGVYPYQFMDSWDRFSVKQVYLQ